MKSGKPSRIAGLALIAALTTGLFAFAFAGTSSAKMKCRYVQAGPVGVRGNILDIRVTRFEESVALNPGKNGVIGVSDDQRMHPVKCFGKKPTMFNIDKVRFNASRAASGSFFTLGCPDFALGATP